MLAVYIVLAASVLLVGYAYVGYPLMLAAAARWLEAGGARRRPPQQRLSGPGGI